MSVQFGAVHGVRGGSFGFVTDFFRIRTELVINITNKFAENKKNHREKRVKPQAAAAIRSAVA